MLFEIFSLKTIIKFMYTFLFLQQKTRVIDSSSTTTANPNQGKTKTKILFPTNLHRNCKHWLSNVAQESIFVQPTNPHWAANLTHCSILHRQAAGQSGLGTAMSLPGTDLEEHQNSSFPQGVLSWGALYFNLKATVLFGILY